MGVPEHNRIPKNTGDVYSHKVGKMNRRVLPGGRDDCPLKSFSFSGVLAKLSHLLRIQSLHSVAESESTTKKCSRVVLLHHILQLKCWYNVKIMKRKSRIGKARS